VVRDRVRDYGLVIGIGQGLELRLGFMQWACRFQK